MLPCSVLQPYPDIHYTISLIHEGAQTILGEDYLSFILHGSLAAGGFDPTRSDVDFLIVTDDEMTDLQYSSMAQMHQHISKSGLPWSTNIEGSYITKRALYRFDPQNCTHPALRTDGSFGRDGHGSDWVLQRWNIREHGIALYGTEPAVLIAPVAVSEMRQAVTGILHSWWEPMLKEEYRLGEAEYQAYAVMTMCRSFYTMAIGMVAPKPEAARFAQEKLCPQWNALITEAAAWHHGVEMEHKELVKEFIRFTIEECDRLLEF